MNPSKIEWFVGPQHVSRLYLTGISEIILCIKQDWFTLVWIQLLTTKIMLARISRYEIIVLQQTG